MKNIAFSQPDITQLEIDEVVDTLKSGWITTGKKTKQFEREIAAYCGTERAVCLNSATAGLQLALVALGIGEGDEVITSSYTYTASASIIHHVGAKIVLCDIGEKGYEMDYDKLASLITPKTKAIIPIDLGGKICNYDKIFEIVKAKVGLFVPNSDYQRAIGRVAVVADSAHSFGATLGEKHSGSIADFSVFSFHAVKNLTTAEGGAITWRKELPIDSDELYHDFMLLSLHGQSKDALAKTRLGAWEYDIKLCGFKCNMTDITASIGLAQLSRYKGMLDRRREIIGFYDNAFASLPVELVEHYTENSASSGHLYMVKVKGINEAQRQLIMESLAERGISCNVHYKPLPLLTAYKNFGFDIKDYPNTYNAYKGEITLPLHTLLTDDEVSYVANNFWEIIKLLTLDQAE